MVIDYVCLFNTNSPSQSYVTFVKKVQDNFEDTKAQFTKKPLNIKRFTNLDHSNFPKRSALFSEYTSQFRIRLFAS